MPGSHAVDSDLPHALAVRTACPSRVRENIGNTNPSARYEFMTELLACLDLFLSSETQSDDHPRMRIAIMSLAGGHGENIGSEPDSAHPNRVREGKQIAVALGSRRLGNRIPIQRNFCLVVRQGKQQAVLGLICGSLKACLQRHCARHRLSRPNPAGLAKRRCGMFHHRVPTDPVALPLRFTQQAHRP